MTFDGDGGQPLMDDDLWSKKTFVGRQPSMEDGLKRKKTFDWRRPLIEDNLRWKTTFDERQTSMEDNLHWKTTFYERRPSMEDNLLWKTTFNGQRPWMETSFNGRQLLIKRFWDSALPYTTVVVIFWLKYRVPSGAEISWAWRAQNWQPLYLKLIELRHKTFGAYLNTLT